MKQTLFYFGYSWEKTRRLDSYQESLVETIRSFGFDVHVYISNFVSMNGQFGTNPYFESRIIRDIRTHKPKIILSINQGSLSHKICDATGDDTSIYTWIVDDPVHLFFPNSNNKTLVTDNILPEKVKVIVSSSDIYQYYLNECPGLKPENLYFLSSATDADKFNAVQRDPVRNIVFVGSYLDVSPAISLLKQASDDSELYDLIKQVISKLTKDYSSKIQEFEHPKLQDLLALNQINFVQFKQVIANLISTRQRFMAVEKLKPLGMEVFGNKEWIDGLSLDSETLDCFKPKKVRTTDQLIEIYQSSKIAVQIPQVQVGPALSYRVFDIMASNALLIHPYNERSDLYHFFGKDCPVPVYRDFDELQSLCKYFLENESERIALVKKCQNLISNNFSFRDRIQFILKTNFDLKSMPDIEPGMVKYHNKRFALSPRGTLYMAFKIFLKSPKQFFLRAIRKACN